MPHEVNASKFDGSEESAERICDEVGGCAFDIQYDQAGILTHFMIYNDRGAEEIYAGDYIIEGSEDYAYVINGNFFEENFNPV